MQIVDAFLVTLGIKDEGYREGIKRYRDDRKRMADDDEKYDRRTHDSQKRTVEGFRSIRNEVTGFLALLGGTFALSSFVKDLVTGAAVTGRFAANIGMATERVSIWENLIKRVGGSAGDARNVLGSLAMAFQNLQLTGDSGHNADFQALGVGAKDLQNPEDALLKIADASGKMSRPEFTARLKRIGFDDATITLLAKGRVEVERLQREQQKLGVTTQKDAEAAQRLEDRLAAIESTIRAKMLPIIGKFVDRLATWLEDEDNFNKVIETTDTVFKGLGKTAEVVLKVFSLLKGAIDSVSDALNKLPNVKAMLGGDDYKNFWDYVGDAIGGEDGATIKRYMGAEGKGSHGKSTTSSGGGSSTGDPDVGTSGDGSDIVSFFKARGYTNAQARGIAAGVMAESGGNHTARNGSSGAFGLGQWLGPRKKALIGRYGPNPTRQQQLEFLAWELAGGDHGGAAVRAQGTESGVLSAYIGSFMRPAAGGETIGDLNRGNAWLARSRTAAPVSSSNVKVSTNGRPGVAVGNVIIYSKATDAAGIARDISRAMYERGIVAQANTGLQP